MHHAILPDDGAIETGGAGDGTHDGALRIDVDGLATRAVLLRVAAGKVAQDAEILHHACFPDEGPEDVIGGRYMPHEARADHLPPLIPGERIGPHVCCESADIFKYAVAQHDAARAVDVVVETDEHIPRGVECDDAARRR